MKKSFKEGVYRQPELPKEVANQPYKAEEGRRKPRFTPSKDNEKREAIKQQLLEELGDVDWKFWERVRIVILVLAVAGLIALVIYGINANLRS